MAKVGTLLQIVVSFVLAADSVAVLVAVAGAGTITAAPVVLLVTGAITALFAMPAYVVLRRYRRETWRSCAGGGLVLGLLVAASTLLPATGYVQIGPEVAVVAGVRTAAGWRMYAEAVGIAGGIGAGAGLVFWAALRLLESGARWPRPNRVALSMGISLAIAASWMIAAIPGLAMDRSCHNVLRDGRKVHLAGPVFQCRPCQRRMVLFPRRGRALRG